MRKKRKKDEAYFENYVNIIKDHQNDLPSWFSLKNTDIKTDSWFNITENLAITTHKNINYNINFNNNKLINS
jgi:hypothetical protein